MEHRVNVRFSPEAYNELQRLAELRNKSVSDILRDAIQLEKWLYQTEQKGERILVERDGVARELITAR